jgi:glycosyltransferase involved in cell wall biosynthesis
VRVRDALRRRPDLGSDSICFAYDTGALEAFEYLRERGVRCVLDQMDPNRVEFDLVREEEKRWPAWALNPIAVPDEYCQRREREWGLADVVVVNSEFCRQALLKQGVPEEKLVVVPLCYELPNPITPLLHHSTTPVRSPLRVLWLGQVILRKGIQYLIEAARLLQGENVRFEVVGPIGISGQAVKSAPDNMTFHGRVTRDQAATWYERADVFVLPTLSDGFAITQLEAMAHGLPVIATPNCGAVVRDGMDGLLVPPRDPVALAKAVARFATDHAFLAECSRTARARVRDFSLAALGDNLLRLGTQTSTLNYQPSTSLSRGPEVSGPVVS